MEANSIEAPDLVDDDGIFETFESIGEEAGLSEREQEFIILWVHTQSPGGKATYMKVTD